jgi:hypothetical protein
MKSYNEIEKKTWEDIATYMIDDLREKVNSELAPCSQDEYMRRYLELDPEFAELLGSEFGIVID